MVDVDVQVDLVGEVVGSGEGAEATGEGVLAIEGKDFENEGEIRVVRDLRWKSEIGIGIEVTLSNGGVERERGVVIGVEEEGGEREEEEWEQVPLRSCSYHYELNSMQPVTVALFISLLQKLNIQHKGINLK